MGDARPFLTAEWRLLAIANWAVDPALLGPLVPAGTELDLWNGDALVSLVGFRFLETRVMGLAIPFHRNFDEVNLRFYVRRRAPDGSWRRGVTFVKEIVPRLAIALVARWVYNEPYAAHPMRHEIEPPPSDGEAPARVAYAWSAGGRAHTLVARPTGRSMLPDAGSEPEFTIEHYWGYTPQRDGGTKEYHVDHVPWRIWTVSDIDVSIDVAAVYGTRWVEALAGRPRLALVAEGSSVSVFPGARIA